MCNRCCGLSQAKKSHEIVDIPYPQRVFGFALG